MIIMIVVNMWFEGFQVCSHRIPDTIIHGIKWRWLYKYISVKKKKILIEGKIKAAIGIIFK